MSETLYLGVFLKRQIIVVVNYLRRTLFLVLNISHEVR